MYYVLTRPDCVWCEKAKQLLDEKGEAYMASSITDNKLFVLLLMKADLKTVPQIWYNSEYIGGYQNLEEYLDAN